MLVEPLATDPPPTRHTRAVISRRVVTLLFGLAAAAALAATGGANGRVVAAAPPAIRLAKALPNVIRIDAELRITGRVEHAPPHTRAVLELKRTSAWRVLARATVRRDGAFTLKWRLPSKLLTGPSSMRVAAVQDATLLAATRAEQVGIGPKAVYCAPPVPPAVDIAVGDGWIVGGRYGEGGPYPGIYACDGDAYTVTATAASGMVAATQQVAALHSYTLVVPAGTYTLDSDGCHGSATVTAGKQTTANTYCLYP